MANYKQQVLAEAIAQDLALRTGLTVVVRNDVETLKGTVGTNTASLGPVIQIGACTTGTVSAAIEVLDQREGASSGFSDLPGFSASGTQPVYTSGAFTLTFEAAAGEPDITYAWLLTIIAVLGRYGGKVSLFTADHGQDVLVAGTTLAKGLNKDTAAGTVEPNIWWTISGRV